MKNRKIEKSITVSVLCLALLLAGCGSRAGITAQRDEAAAPTPAAAAEETAPATEETVPARDETAPDEPERAEVVQETTAAEEYRMLIHMDRIVKDAYDPAEGSFRILAYAWDSVTVGSDDSAEAAAAITEQLAARQDVWYTGTGQSEVDSFGYNQMLEAAEDSFTVAREYGKEPEECAATRYVKVLPTNEDVCAFLITAYTKLDGGRESTVYETLCFDAKTGELLLEESGTDAESLRENIRAHWAPKDADEKAAVTILPLTAQQENRIEIVDRIVVGDGGEACLLIFDGTALDVELWSVIFTDRFYETQQLFYCRELRDCALQMALIFPGDLPNVMLRYRDSSGVHEYLISLSGKDGSIILSQNTFSGQN